MICAPLSPEHTALLMIDLQEEYFLPGGPMELPAGPAALDRAAELLGEARAAGAHVIHVRHVSNHRMFEEFLPGTPRVEIRPEVAPREGETVIDKHVPSAFAGTVLAEELWARGVEAVVIAGFMTATCCTATADEALDLRYRTLFASDATAAQPYGPLDHDEVHERALQAQRGRGGEVLRSRTIGELLQRAA